MSEHSTAWLGGKALGANCVFTRQSPAGSGEPPNPVGSASSVLVKKSQENSLLLRSHQRTHCTDRRESSHGIARAPRVLLPMQEIVGAHSPIPQ